MDNTMKKSAEYSNLVVYGIYLSQESANLGVEALRDRGFRMADISLLLASPPTNKEFAHVKATKAPEGAMYGGGTGAILGGTLGLLAGIGALAIPGVGPFIAAGPIMATLAGAGAGGVTGGIVGALSGVGFPEYEAKRFEGQIQKGGLLISVHCDDSDWQCKAKDILEKTGAKDISSTDEASADSGAENKPREQYL